MAGAMSKRALSTQQATARSDRARSDHRARRAPDESARSLAGLHALGNQTVLRLVRDRPRQTDGEPHGRNASAMGVLRDRLGAPGVRGLVQRSSSPAHKDSEREAQAAAESSHAVGPAPLPAPSDEVVGEATARLGDGEPVSSSLVARRSRELDTDLPSVRLHHGPEARALAAALGARAFAYGDQIVLGARVQQGEDADRTLGHELAHVAQQARSGRAVVQRDGDDVLPPDTVVVVNAPPSVTGDEPLGSWPALGAVLDDDQYAGLRNAMRARELQRRIDSLLATRKTDEGGEVARLQSELDSARAGALSSVQTPLRSILSLQATPVEAGDLRSTVLPLLEQRAPPPLIALAVRNEVLTRFLARAFPEPANVTIAVSATGPAPTFTLADHEVTTERGYIGIEALRQAKGEALDATFNEVAGEVHELDMVVGALLAGREESVHLPGLTERIARSPQDYALLEVRDVAASAHSLAARIATAAGSPAAGELAGELQGLSTQVAASASTLDSLVATAEALHASTQERSLIERHFDAHEKAAEMRRKPGLGALFAEIGYYEMAGDLTPVSPAAPFMGQQHQIVLAYREGRISLSSYREMQSAIATRALIGAGVGLALSLAGGWLGAAAGGVWFGAGSLGAELVGGFGAGSLGAVGALGSEDLYSVTAAAFTSDRATAEYLRGTTHSLGEYGAGVLVGGGLGMAGAWAGHTPAGPRVPARAPAPAGPPVTLFDQFGRPMQVQGGRILEPPVAPVTLATPDGGTIRVLGGQPLEAPVRQGPVSLLQGTPENPRPLIIEGAQEWINRRSQIPGVRPPEYAPSGFGPPIIRGESRILNPQGESVTSLVRPPLPDVLTATGEVAPRTGPVIVDLQSGTGMWLRSQVAQTPGATGVGVEAGNWMLAYRGIYPSTDAEFAAAMASARTGGIAPADPAWRMAGVARPPLLPWERQPMPFFFPERGPVRILPEQFFPAVGEGGVLPVDPESTVGIRPTTHPELWGRADQVYLRRPFALGRADVPTTVALGQELNRMLRPGGFVELRPGGRLDVLPEQLPSLAQQIEGAEVVRVERSAIRAFQRTGELPPGATPRQQEMIRAAAADTAGGLGGTEFQWVVRIYRH
jgi:hypothetical protein